MAANRYEPEVFEAPVRVIPLGHIDADGDLTLGDTVGGHLHGYHLTAEYRELLEDPNLPLGRSRLTPEQRAMLWWMGNQDMVALIPKSSPEEVLDLVPVLRRRLTAVDDLGEAGYRIHVEGVGSFEADELEARFIPFIDGQRRFRDIAELVTGQLLESAQSRAAIERAEREERRTLREFLAEAALNLAAQMRAVGAASIERAE